MEINNSFQKKDKGHFRVAIFGSARVKVNDSAYKRVKDLAYILGEKGIDVVTGGGPGLMQAANEGHKLGTSKSRSGAYSIGIGIKLPWEQKFNKSVQYKEKFNIFSKRLDKFMLLSNVVIVEPGGLGTLLEFFYTWQLIQVRHICHIPIILMGDMWEGLIEWTKKEPLRKGYLDKKDYDLVFNVKTSKQAISIIEDAHKHFKRGGKKFCLNYKKYKIN
jgi:uncharacterized protein (TIGR00730 family)